VSVVLSSYVHCLNALYVRVASAVQMAGTHEPPELMGIKETCRHTQA